MEYTFEDQFQDTIKMYSILHMPGITESSRKQ